MGLIAVIGRNGTTIFIDLAARERIRTLVVGVRHSVPIVVTGSIVWHSRNARLRQFVTLLRGTARVASSFAGPFFAALPPIAKRAVVAIAVLQAVYARGARLVAHLVRARITPRRADTCNRITGLGAAAECSIITVRIDHALRIHAKLVFFIAKLAGAGIVLVLAIAGGCVTRFRTVAEDAIVAIRINITGH